MGLARVFLSLGSNLGDRLGYLREAVRLLRASILDLRVSSVYETDPVYVEDQPKFLNCAAEGRTSLGPLETLEVTQQVERQLGRVPGRPKGPRVIDIDLLLHGSARMRDPRLALPHPGIRERAFVLVPLLELQPDLLDPESGEPYRAYLDSLRRTGVSYHASWVAR